jgi:hypothetical protein
LLETATAFLLRDNFQKYLEFVLRNKLGYDHAQSSQNPGSGGKADLSGTVSFYDGATLLDNRKILDGTRHASLDASNLGLGMHVITASFASANSSFQNSSSPFVFLRRSPPRAVP